MGIQFFNSANVTGNVQHCQNSTGIKPACLQMNGVNANFGLNKDTLSLSMKNLTKDELNKWKNASFDCSRKHKLNHVSSVEGLNKDERGTLSNHLCKCNDIEPFLLVSTGGRPAMCTFKHPLLNKLDKNFDVIPLNDTSVLIFNKKEMLKTIEKYKSFYTKRLRLNESTQCEQIYKTFASDYCLKNLIDVQDLIGISFGYPFLNAVIFQLETDSGMQNKDITKERKNIKEYKKQLIDTLYAKNSRYALLGDEFKDKVAKAINSISSVNSSRNYGYPIGYTFIKTVEEPAEEHRIAENIRNSTAQLKEINKISKKEENERFLNDLTSLENSRVNPVNFLVDLINKYSTDI